MNKKVIIRSLIFVFLLVPFISSNSTLLGKATSINDDFTCPNIPKIDALVDHDPISINGDSGFGPSGENLPGSGTAGDPYRIENYNITTAAEYSIIIRNTFAYFIIQNCYLDANTGGISVISALSGTVEIRDNIAVDHNYRGIELYNCPYSLVENNTVYDARIAGIEFTLSPGTEFNDNKCYNCGFYVMENTKADYLSYTQSQNKVNDKPLGWIQSAYNTGGTAVFYGQYIIVNATNYGVYDMHLANVSYGMLIAFSVQVRVHDSSFKDNTECGIHVYESIDTNIDNCSFERNEYGIKMSYSSDLEVLDSKFTNNKEGIYTDTADTITIDNSDFIDNEWEGIVIQTCDTIVLTNNDFTGGQYAGPYLTESFDILISNNHADGTGESGFWIEVSYDMIIKENIIENNEWGIYLYEVYNTNITYNLMKQNLYEGVYLDTDCYDNFIYLNTFDQNNGDTQQGYDDGYNNTWYDPINQLGNWWSDYVGPGNYSISGAALEFDLYPLNEQPFPYVSEYATSITLGLLAILSFISTSIILIRKK